MAGSKWNAPLKNELSILAWKFKGHAKDARARGDAAEAEKWEEAARDAERQIQERRKRPRPKAPS